jgi:hypothetical protein
MRWFRCRYRLICKRNKKNVSPFEGGESKLLVQIKKHIGITDEWAVEQLCLGMKNMPNADACVMSLADDFTDKAKKLAEDNNILLMNGNEICELLAKYLFKNNS